MKRLMLFVLLFALALIPALAQQQPQPRGPQPSDRSATPTAGQQRPAPPQARQQMPPPVPQRGAQQAPPAGQRQYQQQAPPHQQMSPAGNRGGYAPPRQAPPTMRLPAPVPRYGAPAQRPPHYVYDNRGHRYFDGRGWHPLVIYSGYWGYWFSEMWYPLYPVYYYPYPGPTTYTYAVGISGLKFDLDLIPKDERELVKRGIVYVDGAEVGKVDNFEGFWSSALQLAPGTHEVIVLLKDGRQMETTVGIQEWRITHISLRFGPANQPTLPPPPQNQP
jgi:hypothetical protein